MKKILIFTLITILCACTQNQKSESFINISFTRENEHDTETIRFDDEQIFHYSCGCGNPVNDADLCEKYTYNEITQEITLEYIETTDETIPLIKVVSYENDTLTLDFGNDIRIFTKAE